MVPPLASITAPGWTIQPSPKLIYPCKSAASQIMTDVYFFEEEEPEETIDVFGSYLEDVFKSCLDDVFPPDGLG